MVCIQYPLTQTRRAERERQGCVAEVFGAMRGHSRDRHQVYRTIKRSNIDEVISRGERMGGLLTDFVEHKTSRLPSASHLRAPSPVGTQLGHAH